MKYIIYYYLPSPLDADLLRLKRAKKSFRKAGFRKAIIALLPTNDKELMGRFEVHSYK